MGTTNISRIVAKLTSRIPDQSRSTAHFKSIAMAALADTFRAISLGKPAKIHRSKKLLVRRPQDVKLLF